MRRLLFALLVIGPTVLFGAAPADAGPGFCGGPVELVSNTPIATWSNSATFAFVTTEASTCSGGHQLTGEVDFACIGQTTDSTVIAGHHTAEYTSTYTGLDPALLRLETPPGPGGAAASGSFVLVAAVGQSCATGVTRFIGVGAVVLTE